MGFITMGAAAVGVMMFSLIGPLSKRVDERLLLLLVGILPMLLGRAVMLPIPGVDHPPVNCNSQADWAPDFHEDCDVTSATTTTTTTTISSASYYLHHNYSSQGQQRCSKFFDDFDNL